MNNLVNKYLEDIISYYLDILISLFHQLNYNINNVDLVFHLHYILFQMDIYFQHYNYHLNIISHYHILVIFHIYLYLQHIHLLYNILIHLDILEILDIMNNELHMLKNHYIILALIMDIQQILIYHILLNLIHNYNYLDIIYNMVKHEEIHYIHYMMIYIHYLYIILYYYFENIFYYMIHFHLYIYYYILYILLYIHIMMDILHMHHSNIYIYLHHHIFHLLIPYI